MHRRICHALHDVHLAARMPRAFLNYQKISSGDWPVGTRLPSQRALAEQFDVNRSTITSALDELTAFGIIQSGHGAGTQVMNNTWGLMLPEF